jgi:hypothetical protein
MSDRLSDLLAQRARQGSGVHPTREGVDAVLTRRATRRRRRKAIGSGVAGLVVLAGAVGGFALTGGDDSPDAGIATDPPTSGELPLVGIDLIGYVRDPGADPGPDDVATGAEYGDITYVVFTGEDADPLGPLMTVATHSGLTQLSGTPVDLDGDGEVGGNGDGALSTFPRGAAVAWAEDGLVTAVNGHALSSDEVLAYARQIRTVPSDPQEVPAPEALPHREVGTFGPEPSFPVRVAAYRGPVTLGETVTLQVLTTDEPAYFDLTRIVSTEGVPYEEVPLGESFLGPGVALVSADDDGPTSALIRTDAGLVVHITAMGLDAPVLRTAIETGHLVDLSAEQAPTTAPSTPTTIPTDGQPSATTSTLVTATTAVPSTEITDIRWGTHGDTDRFVIEFAGALPPTHDVDLADRPSAGECVPPETAGVAFVNVHLGLTATRGDSGSFSAIGLGDPVVSVQVACEFEAFVDLVIALDRPVQPIVSELENPARLVIDIPR